MVGEIIKERMLRTLKAEADNRWGDGDNSQDALIKIYLTNLKGACMPDDYIGEDLMKDLYAKSNFFYKAIRDEINPEIDIWIEPDYDDATTTLMVLDDKVLYKDHTKPWNFWFESEEALEDAMYLVYLKVLAKTEKQYECYTLMDADIEAVAERKGLDLENKDMNDVIHYIKKGISWALDNRDEIIEEAIRKARDTDEEDWKKQGEAQWEE